MRLPSASYNLPGRNPARLVNTYPQQSSDKSPFELAGAPGITRFASLGLGPGRGMYVMRGNLYAVSGTTLYRIDENGSEEVLGTTSGSDKLTFAGNGTQIVTSNKFIFSGGTVNPITDPDLPTLQNVDFIDGYVVYAESGSGRWGCSQLYDGATYDGLDFATAEAYPDDLVTLKVDHRQVLLFGQETTEIWYNNAAGGSGFPFERLQGGFLELGCLARHGVAKQDNSVFWLANDRTIRRLAGQIGQRVSHHGVEEAISSYSRVDDCEAFPMAWNGHLFVVFRFPTAGACWVLDVTTGEWHERQTYGNTDWLMRDAVQCYGKTLVQHSVTGEIGYLSDSVYTEFDQPIRREITFPSVYASDSRLFHAQLDAVFKTGDAPVNVTPYISLDLSDDGGNTFVTLPMRAIQPMPLGLSGEYQRIARWTRLGSSRNRVYRISGSSPAPWHLLDTALTVAQGRP